MLHSRYGIHLLLYTNVDRVGVINVRKLLEVLHAQQAMIYIGESRTEYFQKYNLPCAELGIPLSSHGFLR